MAPEQGSVRKKEMNTVPKSWIYALTKSEIIVEIEIHKLNTEGMLDELHHRPSTFVNEKLRNFQT